MRRRCDAHLYPENSHLMHHMKFEAITIKDIASARSFHFHCLKSPAGQLRDQRRDENWSFEYAES